MKGRKEKFRDRTLQHERRFPIQLNFLPPDPLRNHTPFRIYLYMKLQVFIHGIDVIKDVMCNSRNDSHELRVVQLPLRTRNQTVTRKAVLRHKRGASLAQTRLPPAGPCRSGGDSLEVSSQKGRQNDSTCWHSSPHGAPICFVSSCHLPSTPSRRYLHRRSPTKDRRINTNTQIAARFSPLNQIFGNMSETRRIKAFCFSFTTTLES